MALDPLELRLISALERYETLRRRTSRGESAQLTERVLAELGTTVEALRAAHEQIVEHRRHRAALQAELEAERAKYSTLFNDVPDAYVIARPDTTILDVNRAGAELFNVSQRFLIGKTLSIFVCEDRPQLLAASMRVAQQGEPQDLKLKVRPRERAPLAIDASAKGDNGNVQWTLKAAHMHDVTACSDPANGARRARGNGCPSTSG